MVEKVHFVFTVVESRRISQELKNIIQNMCFDCVSAKHKELKRSRDYRKFAWIHKIGHQILPSGKINIKKANIKGK